MCIRDRKKAVWRPCWATLPRDTSTSSSSLFYRCRKRAPAYSRGDRYWSSASSILLAVGRAVDLDSVTDEQGQSWFYFVVCRSEARIAHIHVTETGQHLERAGVEVGAHVLVKALHQSLYVLVGGTAAHESRQVFSDLCTFLLDALPVFLCICRRLPL